MRHRYKAMGGNVYAYVDGDWQMAGTALSADGRDLEAHQAALDEARVQRAERDTDQAHATDNRRKLFKRLINELIEAMESVSVDTPKLAEQAYDELRHPDTVVTLLFGIDHQGREFFAIDDVYPSFKEMTSRLHSRAEDRDDPNPLPDVLIKFEAQGIGIDVGDMHYDPIWGLEVGGAASTTLWANQDWTPIVAGFLHDLKAARE